MAKRLIGIYKSGKDSAWGKPTNPFIGYRGRQSLDAGYVYAPYVPLMMTPEVVGLPLTRRVFASTVANEMVNVQPNYAPTGQIFYYDYPAMLSMKRNLSTNNERISLMAKKK